MTLRVVVVGNGPEVAEVCAELQNALPQLDIAHFPTVTHVQENLATDLPVPLVCVLPDRDPADHRIDELAKITHLRGSRVLLLTTAGAHADVARAIDAGRVDAFVALPMTAGFLGQHAQSHIARWKRLQRPGELVVKDDFYDQPRSELLRDMEASAHVVEAELVEAIEAVLGSRPRLRLPAGVRLTRQGHPVDGVFVILSGRVALTRHTESEDLLLHHASTGPVVGLLSLSRTQLAFFTATTTTDVEVIHLSLEQLDRALALNAQVGAALAAVAIRGLGARLLRSEQLQVERNDLNLALQQERSNLAKALQELEAARMEVIAQARFATLGELAAGIAHELNNPLAALTRAADHLADDIAQLLDGHPTADNIRTTIERSRNRQAIATSTQRQLRRELSEHMARETAWRLVAAGIDSVAAGRQIASGGPSAVAAFEQAARVGADLRGISVASKRIMTLVAALRSYARPDDAYTEGVRVEDTLEDSVQLLSHRLHGIEIEREYTETKPLYCHPSQLGQVWTNVLVNSAEALSEAGGGHDGAAPTITIETAMAGETKVRVRLIDNGPGIASAVLPKVFTPHFTTKGGVVRFGLGMGLGLAAHIVNDHGGDISIDSHPGHTAVTVTLPVIGADQCAN